MMQSFRAMGGYMRRWEPTILKRLLGNTLSEDEHFALDERVTLAFLQADVQVLDDSSIDKCARSSAMTAEGTERAPSRPSR